MLEEISLAENIDELYQVKLGAKQFAFIYAGYAGVLFRTNDKVILFDLSNLFNKVKKHIQSLDLITYSHSHSDHYEFSNAVALQKKTQAQVISEFAMADELRSRIPSENILSGPEALQGVRDGPKFNLDGIRVELHRGVHPRQIVQ